MGLRLARPLVVLELGAVDIGLSLFQLFLFLGLILILMSLQPFNSHVEDLHEKLSGGERSNSSPPTTSGPSMEIKYPPSRRPGGHYSELARAVSIEKKVSLLPQSYIKQKQSSTHTL